MERGQRTLILTFVTAFLLGGAYALPGQQGNKTGDKISDKKNVIKITAQMFKYTPSQIELKKGKPVTLELSSLDRIHGFHIPDLGLRADVLPGRSVRVEILPQKTGRYTFLCDIFCGDGHDEMNGVIVVKE